MQDTMYLRCTHKFDKPENGIWSEQQKKTWF